MNLHQSTLLGVALSLVLGAAACGGSGGDRQIGNQDDLVTGAFSIDESAVVGRVEGDRLRVRIPIAGQGALRGTARVRLHALTGERLARGEADFDLTGPGVAEVDVPAVALAEPGVTEATQLVYYEVRVGKRQASGWKSLVYVLPKLDLRTRLPGQLVADGAAKVRVFAIDPTRDTPLPGVDVVLTLTDDEGETLELVAQTSDAGSAVFDVPPQEAGEYTVTARAREGATVLASLEEDLQVVRQARVLVTTDKPLYQPGQTMHIRALALAKPRLDAVAAAPAGIEVRDGKGNMVFRKVADTNAFGIVSTDFKIATQVNVGDYEIRVNVGETVTSKTVKVEPYTLPKFKVAATVDQPFYLAGETVEGVVDARYFFGKPVAGGAVTIVASAAEIGLNEFARFTGTTDAEGLLPFSVDLPDYLVGQPLEGGHGLVTLDVQVIDTASQEETKRHTLVVAAEPVHLVAIPESGRLARGLDNGVFIVATDPLGRPVDATFTVRAGDADLTVEPLSAGLARVTVTPEGPVSFDVTATEAGGATTARTFDFDPGAAVDSVLVRTDKALYRVGETVDLQVLATAAGGRAFLDVIKDGQTVLTQTLTVADGVGAYALDLDAGLVGDLLVEAYVVTPEAKIVRDKKLIFVRDADGLTIDMRADKDQYRPGEEATLTFTVTDAEGAPKVAALGVQIVDEAVYALSDNKPGLLETYFLIQEALQTPSYQVDAVSFDLSGLVTQPPEDEDAQTVARAAFAALDTAAVGEQSSWQALSQGIGPTLQPFYAVHTDEMAGYFQTLKNAGVLTWSNAEQLIEAVDSFWDFWGQPYTITAESDWDGWRARVTSSGPDEIADTADDFTTTVEVLVESWDDMDFDAAADAGGPGGPPQPAAPQNTDENVRGGGGDAIRVRQDFPETLFYNPALITDPSGEAQVTLTMADSITEWRVTTLGNTASGVVGSASHGVTVFQDFFVDVSFPASLTQNDAVTFPVAVYNYLPTEQDVVVSIVPAPWFAVDGPTSQVVTLGPSEVTSVSFPVVVKDVGVHALTVVGQGDTLEDAVQRLVRVQPDGVRRDASESGILEGTVEHTVTYPTEAIAGSEGLLVKVYPGLMAQAVEGLDGMLQLPTGCFEQTTATNWPNTLVLDYLRTTGQTSPEIELKALDYLQQGYQRLLTYECTGGGFVWFGDPAPANVILSAMGVLEFSDMAKVIDVDPDVISRTADWLVGAQRADGSWTTNQGSEFATVQYDDVKTTAFSAWALASSPHGAAAVDKALTWLAPHATASETDVYSLAMMANAFATAEPDSVRTSALLTRLADLAEVDEEGRVSWAYEGNSYNYWGSQGGVDPTSIEVTALAVQAFVAGGVHLDLVGGAVAYLAGQKDGLGNYGTTHATILTLRAMIKSLTNQTEEGEGTVTVSVGGASVATLDITAENRNVFHQLDLADVVDTAEGSDVTIAYVGTGKLMYQLVSSWYAPVDPQLEPPSDILELGVSYDTTELSVSDVVTATVAVKNLSEGQLDMVMLDLGVPPGFTVLPDALDQLVASGTILKWEKPGQQISIYLEKLAPQEALTISYQLRADYPVEATAPSSSAYLYYDRATRQEVAGTALIVR